MAVDQDPPSPGERDTWERRVTHLETRLEAVEALSAGHVQSLDVLHQYRRSDEARNAHSAGLLVVIVERLQGIAGDYRDTRAQYQQVIAMFTEEVAERAAWREKLIARLTWIGIIVGGLAATAGAVWAFVYEGIKP
jgi:hypothetical protein